MSSSTLCCTVFYIMSLVRNRVKGQWDSKTVGTVAHWGSGTVGHWDNDIVGQWDIGALRQWSNETVGCEWMGQLVNEAEALCCCGKMTLVSKTVCTETLGQWGFWHRSVELLAMSKGGQGTHNFFLSPLPLVHYLEIVLPLRAGPLFSKIC